MFSNISNDRQAAFLLKCIVDIFMNIENKPIRRSSASKSNTTRTTPKSMDAKRSPSKVLMFIPARINCKLSLT